jgi:hypothetical protein
MASLMYSIADLRVRTSLIDLEEIVLYVYYQQSCLHSDSPCS